MRPFAICGALLLVISVTAGDSRAQGRGDGEKSAVLDRSLQMMRAETWQQRSMGFYQLVQAELGQPVNGTSRKISPAIGSLMQELPDHADSLATALIETLRRENAVSATSQTTEEFSSYRGDLALAVAGLTDKRALTALVEILDTGNVATQGVARLGASTALRPLTDLAFAASDLKRNAATRALGFLLDPSINPERVTASQRADIKAALARATADSNPFVRVSAIEGLSRVPDPEIVGLLRRLSDSDPYSTIEEAGQVVFPVRQAAKRVLRIEAPR